MENSSGSRQRALAICQSAGPGTVGAIIARILTTPLIHLSVRFELASGDIGSFYAQPDIRAIINSAWTDGNLRELARRETLFFNTQPGMAGRVGRLLNEDERFCMLRFGRDNLF